MSTKTVPAISSMPAPADVASVAPQFSDAQKAAAAEYRLTDFEPHRPGRLFFANPGWFGAELSVIG